MNLRRVQSLSDRTSGQLRRSMTLNLTNGMSATEMQAKINLLPRFIPTGSTLTIQFANGTYTLNSPIIVSNFYGSGSLFVTGNTGETAGLHTNQAVILDSTGYDISPFGIVNVQCPILFQYIRLKVKTTSLTGERYGLYLRESNTVYVRYSFLEGTATTALGILLDSRHSKANVLSNYFDNSSIAVRVADEGIAYVYDNSTSATGNTYSYNASGASFIGRRLSPSGLQPTGSLLAEVGGVIV